MVKVIKQLVTSKHLFFLKVYMRMRRVRTRTMYRKKKSVLSNNMLSEFMTNEDSEQKEETSPSFSMV